MIEITSKFDHERSFKLSLLILTYTRRTHERICWHRETVIKFLGITIYSNDRTVTYFDEL